MRKVTYNNFPYIFFLPCFSCFGHSKFLLFTYQGYLLRRLLLLNKGTQFMKNQRKVTIVSNVQFSFLIDCKHVSLRTIVMVEKYDLYGVLIKNLAWNFLLMVSLWTHRIHERNLKKVTIHIVSLTHIDFLISTATNDNWIIIYSISLWTKKTMPHLYILGILVERTINRINNKLCSILEIKSNLRKINQEQT